MQPNILWICTDQQRFDTIAALSNPHIHTPNIDRLVRAGAVSQYGPRLRERQRPLGRGRAAGD